MAAKLCPLALAGSLVLVAGILRLPAGGEALAAFRSLAASLTWLDAIGAVGAAFADFVSIVIRSIPPPWLYGGLALFAGLYATLFGLGAVATLRSFQASQ